SVAEALALPEVAAGTGVAIGARGAEQVRIVRVDSMRIGTATAHDLLACVTDLDVLRAIGPGVRGLVGLNFMKPFRVTLDFRAEQVTFTELRPGAGSGVFRQATSSRPHATRTAHSRVRPAADPGSFSRRWPAVTTRGAPRSLLPALLPRRRGVDHERNDEREDRVEVPVPTPPDLDRRVAQQGRRQEDEPEDRPERAVERLAEHVGEQPDEDDGQPRRGEREQDEQAGHGLSPRNGRSVNELARAP